MGWEQKSARIVPQTRYFITGACAANAVEDAGQIERVPNKGYQVGMTQEPNSSGKTSGSKDSPEWADGLRKLYDSVVEEPLPDSFMDLLSKLDEPKGNDEA